MGKSLYIAEKPSVAREFAKVLRINTNSKDGYLESEEAIVTWCVGHLVTMSYPEKYDSRYKRWQLETLPFLPKEFKYEVIETVQKQFNIVSRLLNRSDVSKIYVCTDSGREGEYIYRLVDQMANVGDKEKYRVWIDSQTEEEIIRGIKEAKPLSEYDNLSDAAYLRAIEDYLMGINFSRLLTLKYGPTITNYLKTKNTVIAVGRVMTCVLGMVVRREREIRNFVKTPFYRVISSFQYLDKQFEGEWRGVEGSRYYQSPYLYKENGFKDRAKAEELIELMLSPSPLEGIIERVEKKKENKNPPLLYNLAELQNDASRMFKLSPDETLKIAQELYEKKLITYPRTDARVLSTAVAKDIYKIINGLKGYEMVQAYAGHILTEGNYKNIHKTRYVNDKQITDHYAIIPTGQGLSALRGLSLKTSQVYEVITRRFISIFYPAAVYQKISLVVLRNQESFFSNFRLCIQEGYLAVAGNSFDKKNEDKSEEEFDQIFLDGVMKLKKGMVIPMKDIMIKEGETSPPKRYSSGSIILAMENAGQLIEDEQLREQIKGSGIGTSATRAEILKKLIHINYLSLNKKTQIVSTTQLGEMIFDVVENSIKPLLNPELTASWEKGLTYVSNGEIQTKEYMVKLEDFIQKRTSYVLGINNQYTLIEKFDVASQSYQGKKVTKENSKDE